ncbi:MAG: inositol monophosphatase family protein [Pirellulales bacterium]|jgi:histidinol phosphatase-like enzyme (inositol monophosphatase family)
MLDPGMDKRLEIAIAATRKAGQKTLQWFRTDNLTVTRKNDQSPVTAADVAAEKILQKELLASFPEDSFLGEETGCTKGCSEYEWVVDPIDGTKSFIQGVPLFATLVGCRKNGEGVLGVIYIPALEEIAYASVGQGAWYEQRGHDRVPARVSTKTLLSESLLCSSDFRDFRRRPPELDAKMAGREVRDDIEDACRIVRTWGDGYGYLLVATGRAEAMADPMLNAWDAAAVAVVVTEAGGKFTDWTGVCNINAGDGIASNGSTHENLLKLLSPAAIRGK